MLYRSDLQFYSSVVFTGLDREVQMIYSEEGIWEVGAYGMEILPSYRESPDRDFQEEVLYAGQYNYRGFIKTKDQKVLSWREPLDILGMYFYAGEIGDYATQYEMFYPRGGFGHCDKEDLFGKSTKSTSSPYS